MVITLLCGQIALIYFYKALKKVEENFLKKKNILLLVVFSNSCWFNELRNFNDVLFLFLFIILYQL